MREVREGRSETKAASKRREAVEKTLAHVGFDALHPDTSLNFQLNRWMQWLGDDAAYKDIREVALRISSYQDWQREFLALAERASTEKRDLHAAYYFRSAEFFMTPDDPRKRLMREKFLTRVRGSYAITDEERYQIPYEGSFLPAYRFAAEVGEGVSVTDTVVIFGGFDSYIEEFFPLAFFFTRAGYDVVLFEGPGQGGALEDAHLSMTPEWEKPTGVVLDYFGLKRVTLLGLSLGGTLALRAAAYEPRVKRAIADDVLTNFQEANLGQLNPAVRAVLRGLLATNAKGIVNQLIARAMQTSPVVGWGIRQGMHVTGTTTPYSYLKETGRYTTARVSPLVTSDVLILAGAEDHYVPREQFYEQLRTLENARSLTGRVFTQAENAQNHCHVGNLRLSFAYISSWIKQMITERAEETT